MLENKKKKNKKVGIISALSSIVIEGIKTLFSEILKKKEKETEIQLLTNLKKNLAHWIINWAIKHFSGDERFIINWAINKTLKKISILPMEDLL